MTTTLHSVHDRRHGWVGAWEVEPLAYDQLKETDVGRTVIYHGRENYEAGKLTSWRDGVVYAQFDTGCTSAGCRACDVSFGVGPLDGDLDR